MPSLGLKGRITFKNDLRNSPCEAVEQPLADHFHQKFETIHQMFQKN